MDSTGQQLAFKTCYAQIHDDGLIVGNSYIERRWRIRNGLLYASSLRNLITGYEWLAHPAEQPAPFPNLPLADEARALTCDMTIRTAKSYEAASLYVTLTATGASLRLDYQFRLFPDASGIVMQLNVQALTASENPAHSDSTAVESLLAPGLPGSTDSPELMDSLESLDLSSPHLELTQVELKDQTDIYNTLVQERTWLSCIRAKG